MQKQRETCGTLFLHLACVTDPRPQPEIEKGLFGLGSTGGQHRLSTLSMSFKPCKNSNHYFWGRSHLQEICLFLCNCRLVFSGRATSLSRGKNEGRKHFFVASPCLIRNLIFSYFVIHRFPVTISGICLTQNKLSIRELPVWNFAPGAKMGLKVQQGLTIEARRVA